MRLLRIAALLTVAALLGACDSGEGSSLYDPDDTGNTAPVVTSVSPTGLVLAGVDEVTIEGQNFSADPAENVVFFDDGQGNAGRGEVLDASATRLVVKTPNLPNPALQIRVAVVGARDFSNGVAYPLTPAFVPFGALGPTEEPFGLATGADGTLYVSMSDDGAASGVKRFAPDGSRSDYFETTFLWADLTVADGELVGVRRIRAIFTLPEGGRQTVLAAFQPSSVTLTATASRADGVVYTAGNSGLIYRINPDGAVAEVAFAPTVTGLTVAGDVLFAVGQQDGTNRLWRFPLAADGAVGAPEAVADLPARPRAVAVASDGTVYVGTEAVGDPVYTVSPAGAVAPLYPDILTGPAISLAFGAGTQLYMSQGSRVGSDGSLIRGDLIEIEARVTGAR